MPDPIPLRPWKAHEMDFALAENVRNTWRWTAPHGVVLKDALEPERWSHIARKLRRGDVVEIIAADGSFYAETFVLAIEGLLVHLRPLVAWEAAEGEATAPSPEPELTTAYAKVRFVVAAGHRWRVESAAGEVISKGHETREAAEAAMLAYGRSIGRVA